ncbi:hypothetical protein Tco_0603527 [Tanacetum coccineum]
MATTGLNPFMGKESTAALCALMILSIIQWPHFDILEDFEHSCIFNQMLAIGDFQSSTLFGYVLHYDHVQSNTVTLDSLRSLRLERHVRRHWRRLVQLESSGEVDHVAVQAHPNLNKTVTKHICRILDYEKFSMEVAPQEDE